MADNWGAEHRRRERQVRNESGQSERLCYFLRHHPAKDKTFAAKGIPGGWFLYSDILPWMKHLSESQLDTIVRDSRSFIPPHNHRFESRVSSSGEKYIRAAYGHTFDTSFSDIQENSNSGILSLSDILLTSIALQIQKFGPQLADFRDGPSISLLFNKCKDIHKDKLSNKVIKYFLLPQVPSLDFKGLLLDETILRAIPKLCPDIMSLGFEGCFTNMTDTNLQFLLKRCKSIVQLDLSGCKFLTSVGITHVAKFGTNLSLLSLRWLKCIDSKLVDIICTSLQDLQVLNITGCLKVSQVELESLRERFPLVYIQFDSIDPETDAYIQEEEDHSYNLEDEVNRDALFGEPPNQI